MFKVIQWVMGLLTGNVVEKIADVLIKKADADVQKHGQNATVAVEYVRGEQTRRQAQASMAITAMSHPVWWVAWGLGVIPVLAYHGSVFFVSTFDTWINPGCFGGDLTGECARFIVRKVPEAQEKVGNAVVEFVFLAQIGAGAVGAVVQGAKSILGQK